MARAGRIRSYKLHRIFLVLNLLADIAVMCASFLLAWWVRFDSGLIPLRYEVPLMEAYLWALPLNLAVYLVVFNYSGFYQRRLYVVGRSDIGSIVRAVVIASLLIFALGFLYRGFSYSRLVLAIMAVLNILFLKAGREALFWLQVWLRKHGVGVVRVAILGDGVEAREVAEGLRRHPGYGFELLGFIGARRPGLRPHIGATKSLERILGRTRIDELVIAPSRSVSRAAVVEYVMCARKAGVECRMLADVFGMVTSRLGLEELFGMPMFYLRGSPLDRAGDRFIKRLLDVTLSVVGLVFIAPVMVIIAVLVKLDSKGPVLYRQERTGMDDRSFKMLKFRSMRADAEEKSGPVWARRGDPRTTRIGGFMRRASLDELPQFFNVLKGDMSLVGPRPERPAFVEQFSRRVPRYPERHQVRPGLTGWAQVNGLRGNTSVEERIKYDLYYIENWSVWLDLRIIFRTAMEVFHHSEAY